MIRTYQAGSAFQHYDFCICGAGPAGIALAVKLSSYGWKTLLLEGGGLEYSDQSQSLYNVHISGRELYAASTRLRFLGGTSNHWTGRCRPFVASDFELSEQGGLPGWPIDFSEMQLFLPAAMGMLDLPPSDDFKAINDGLPGGNFEADRFLLSPPTRFSKKYYKALQDSQLCDVFLNCNCVDLDFDHRSGGLSAIQVSDYNNNRSKVKARSYILAMGGIENARMLLNSESLASAGVADQNGFVGRCFMEHLNVDLGSFIYGDVRSTSARQYFTTDKFIKKYGVGKGNVSFGIIDEIKSYGRTAAIKNFFKNLACDLGVSDKVQFISKFDCPGAGDIGTLIEQAPNINSRITLLKDRDRLGVRIADVNWSLNQEDIKTVRTIGLEMAKNFAEAKLGFVKLNQYIYDDTRHLPVTPHAHHMGTTRMASSSKYGVVDRNCKVFGVSNLFVAGSSVFSTGGGCNPTMPIAQLCLRLADHLNRLHRL